jgi:hypothetical protein
MFVVTLYGLTSCRPQDIPCNGLHPGTCNDTQTCCSHPGNDKVCCPILNGVCCSDGCCPSGYSCGDNHKCYPNLKKPIPAIRMMTSTFKKL